VLKKSTKTRQKTTRKLIEKNYAMLTALFYLFLHIAEDVSIHKKEIQ